MEEPVLDCHPNFVTVPQAGREPTAELVSKFLFYIYVFVTIVFLGLLNRGYIFQNNPKN